MNLSDFSTNGQTPKYPVSLALNQIGADNLELTPSQSLLAVSGIGWNSSPVFVTVTIPSAVAADPALNEDGDELVAKLQLSADSPHLKTPTDILVKIKLVHPTPSACLRVYDFITDASLANTVTSTEVNVNNKGKITSTNPYGSLSHNVMVVNICEAVESFDLRVNVDPWFSTQPNNNPGNAVFTFATAGEIDAAAFNIASFGAGTAQGQNLCLQNVVVPAGSTFLATVHMNINNGSLASSLPGSKVFSGFTSMLTAPGASCGGTPDLDRHVESGIGAVVLLNQVTSGQVDCRSCDVFVASAKSFFCVQRIRRHRRLGGKQRRLSRHANRSHHLFCAAASPVVNSMTLNVHVPEVTSNRDARIVAWSRCYLR